MASDVGVPILIPTLHIQMCINRVHVGGTVWWSQQQKTETQFWGQTHSCIYNCILRFLRFNIAKRMGEKGRPWQTPTSTGKVFYRSEDFETLVTQMAYDSLGTPYSCTPTGLLMEHSRRHSPSPGNKCIMNKEASIMPDAPESWSSSPLFHGFALVTTKARALLASHYLSKEWQQWVTFTLSIFSTLLNYLHFTLIVSLIYWWNVISMYYFFYEIGNVFNCGIFFIICFITRSLLFLPENAVFCC